MNNEFRKNVIKVALSNIVTILSGILVGFFIPKLMGPTNYGLYKIYSLYLTYIGLFNIGFVEGIYIKYGGVDYGKLDKKEFRMFTRFLFYVEVVFTIIVFGISFFLVSRTYSIIFCLLGLSIIGKIMTGYFQFVSQLSSRFKELAFRNIINAILTILNVLFLFTLYKLRVYNLLDFRVYIVLTILIQLLLFSWYCYTYKDIIFGESYLIKDNKKSILNLIKIGSPLLIANLIGTLVLSMDRQFISILFDNSTYGVYAFAYNILTLIITAISALSTVLYPSLKRKERDNIICSYYMFSKVTLVVVFLLLSSYYLMIPIINYFLSDYSGAIAILKVIYPIIVFQSLVTIVIHNYFKALEKTNLIFIQSVITLFFSIVLNFIFYKIFGTAISISYASVIIVIIWYLVSEISLLKGLKNIHSHVYIIIMLICFLYEPSNIWYINFIIYVILYLILTMLFFGKNIIKRSES